MLLVCEAHRPSHNETGNQENNQTVLEVSARIGFVPADGFLDILNGECPGAGLRSYVEELSNHAPTIERISE